MVKDIYPGMFGSEPPEGVVFAGKFFFPATAPTTMPAACFARPCLGKTVACVSNQCVVR